MRLVGPIPRILLLALLFGATVSIASAATAASGAHPLADRESTYPDEILNITQDPWNVKRGDDIRVTMTLSPDAAVPDRVSLIWCRVEPDYVCGLPVMLEPQSERVWTATILGQYGPEVLIRDDTLHIGYNISLRYDAPLFAPTHNTWVPDTFPEETGGKYYFVPLGEPAQQVPAVALMPLLLGLLALIVVARRHEQRDPGGGRDG